jgi:hypothetical protein
MLSGVYGTGPSNSPRNRHLYHTAAAGPAAAHLVLRCRERGRGKDGRLAGFAPQVPLPRRCRLVPVNRRSPVVEVKPAVIPLPSGTNDYLLAHQGFSPRVSLQGMLPYVRTVSEQVQESRK